MAGASADPGPLGILAGGGPFPLRIAGAAVAGGRRVFVLVLEGWGDAADFTALPHAVERPGAAGRIRDHLRRNGVRQVVMAGKVTRPSITSVRPDGLAAKLLAKAGRAVFAGDDGILKAVARAFEDEGFEVLPVSAVLGGVMPAAGLLTRTGPEPQARADIARGIAVVRALGVADVGQCAVVQQGLVLGVEAIEGTDALLARCADLRRDGPGGVLVKLVKPGQDRRLDLPTIGPATVSGAIAAGLAGIAIEAGGTILVDREATLAAADAAGIFVLAIRPEAFNETETTP